EAASLAGGRALWRGVHRHTSSPIPADRACGPDEPVPLGGGERVALRWRSARIAGAVAVALAGGARGRALVGGRRSRAVAAGDDRVPTPVALPPGAVARGARSPDRHATD